MSYAITELPDLSSAGGEWEIISCDLGFGPPTLHRQRRRQWIANAVDPGLEPWFPCGCLSRAGRGITRRKLLQRCGNERPIATGPTPMIRYEVSNHDEQRRQWQVEPYGDTIDLAPGDTMTVEFEHTAELVFQVSLYSEGLSELWVLEKPDGQAIPPDDLKHNDVTVWPNVQR